MSRNASRDEVSRAFIEGFANVLVDAESPMLQAIHAGCVAHLEHGVRDPVLREKLRPTYRAACKRLIVSDGFYDAIQRPNATLVTEGIARIEPGGVRTRDGRLHELDVLVATTVIEVGIDVPNATVMVIQDAERFGLAQLHQLRGRIGRGSHDAWCILMVRKRTPDVLARLRILEETHDGFRIAEEDLRQRGPGEFLGGQQSGLPEFRFADLATDRELVERARTIAGRLL